MRERERAKNLFEYIQRASKKKNKREKAEIDLLELKKSSFKAKKGKT